MSLVIGLLCLIVFPLKIAAILALAFSAGHFHGREKRDHERDEHMKPPHLKGYLMWRWHWDQITDFWPTAFVMLALMIIVWMM